MADPFSIATGVLAVVGACFKVGQTLRTFCSEVGSVNDTLAGILHDVEGLATVLNSIKETFEHIAQPSTGHVGVHWANIGRSLADGKNTLHALEETVTKVNKDVAFLDGPRKQVRLKASEGKINEFRKQIQAFRDAMQLSLQTLTLYDIINTQSI